MLRMQIVNVRFLEGTSVAQKQAAISSVGGSVIGGTASNLGEGVYIVRVPLADTPAKLVRVALSLMDLPQVAAAYLIDTSDPDFSSYLRPNDGPGMQKVDWASNRQSAAGDNWALERIEAPLAWGCGTGDAGVRVSVIDRNFRQLNDFGANIAFIGEYATPTVGLFDHGTQVSSVIAALGHNNQGIAGVAWNAQLDLRNRTSLPPDYSNSGFGLGRSPDELLEDNIVQASLAGSVVINLSQNIGWRTMNPPVLAPSLADSAQRHNILTKDRALRNALSRLAGSSPSFRPLVVLSAGNDSVPADLEGFVGARAAFPNQIVVVGAIGRNSQVWQLSAFGSSVDVYAPGVDVATLNANEMKELDTGTSFAAPLVAGVAALLKSFDSRLTASEIKSLILQGAVDSVAAPDGLRPILNAYGALKKAAERPGAPLCGNRVFIKNGTQLTIERLKDDPASDEVIGTWPRGWPVLYVEHGGRVISNGFFTSSDERWTHSATGWVLQSGHGNDQNSGFLLGHEGSTHDRDSIVAAIPNQPINPTSFRFCFADPSTGACIGPLSQPLSQSYQGSSGLDPSRPLYFRCCTGAGLGDTVNLATGHVGPFTTNGVLGLHIDHLGVAEDGSEMRLLTREANVQCHVNFISLKPADFGLLKRRVTLPLAPNLRCSGDGAIAPRVAPSPEAGIGVDAVRRTHGRPGAL